MKRLFLASALLVFSVASARTDSPCNSVCCPQLRGSTVSYIDCNETVTSSGFTFPIHYRVWATGSAGLGANDVSTSLARIDANSGFASTTTVRAALTTARNAEIARSTTALAGITSGQTADDTERGQIGAIAPN